MEEKEEIQQSHLLESEARIEETSDNCKENNQENIVVLADEQSCLLDDGEEVKSKDERENNMETQEPIPDAEKCEETNKKENKEISSQKGKTDLKQKHKANHTVPQPFYLATEKRMSRDRHRGLEHPIPKPNPAKSTSSFKYHTQTSERVERSSELKHENTRTSSKSTYQHSDRTDTQSELAHKIKEKRQAKDVESKKSPVTIKEEEDLEIKKLRKSSTFKASPLPSFYTKKPPPKPELKKIPLTRPKSPLFHQRSKSISGPSHRRSKSISELSNNTVEAFNRSISESGNNKIEAITKHVPQTTSVSASTSESKTTKPEAVHKTTTSRTISSSAKEAINRLLRGTWKSSNTQRRESVNG